MIQSRVVPKVKCLVLWAVFVLPVGVAYAQKNCEFATKCNGCIQIPGCMWCSNVKASEVNQISHCIPTSTSNVSSVCDDERLENPETKFQILENVSLSRRDKSQRNNETIVQMAPQKFLVNLRKGTSQKINLTYKQAKGYPIDLYYLMDLSNSMKDDKDQLAKLGESLTDVLKNLTKSYTIGFGSFVDKVMRPFVDMHPKKLREPCINCQKPFSFRNDLPLGPNGASFSKKVSDAKISVNLDDPEGGFDALMQVLVCKNEIGWRDQARKLVVFSTDAMFHHAGDGKLAGLVTPNDEECHLKDGEYYAYDKFDYPSIGQINKMSKEKDIYIIFAVSNYEDIYKELSDLLEHSSYGKLSNDSSNIVELVREQYNKISSTISLTDNSSSALSIRYTSNCKNSNVQPTSTNQCLDMRDGDQVTFTLDLKLNDCPIGKDKEVVEVKTLQDSIILEIEYKCSCDCEQNNHTTSAEKCNKHGTLMCGICECYEGYMGENCTCAADGTGEDGSDEEKCKADDLDLCSGRGYCACGACKCTDKNWFGRYCHCDKRNCFSDEFECSGHGTCVCNNCKCNPGYEGEKCECPTEEACIMMEGEKVCSGNGECYCGTCECNGTYGGRYCEDCSECSDGKCSTFNEDVKCHFNNPANECHLNVSYASDLKENLDQSARLCFFTDEDGCQIIYTYQYVKDDKSYEIKVQKEKECPENKPVMGIVFSILASVVVIGILTLLLWKLITTIYDHKEYERFVREQRNTQFGSQSNPLYRDPLNTFTNPAYSQLQQRVATQENQQK